MRALTFNDFLMQVDRAWSRSKQSPTPVDWRVYRGEFFYAVVNKMRPRLAKRLCGTPKDPRQVEYDDLDSWLGWFVVEWNRSASTQ